MHLGTFDDLLILLPVRSESYSAMEEYFQIGPYFFQRLLAGFLQYVFDEHQHPGGHSREVGDIGVERAVGYCFHLGLKITHQGDLLARHADVIHQRVYILYQYGG